ncbi:hypothetical protein FA95DRAFT_1611632 [Auriscalpium vulgare]|uniref:Uncharacterized protein n=1 Tax=Auriscalpium vulgare TaxID=40419 RepID=A0ACB8R9H8_9AGAM|nr:hypothetical protein FA95DRAFT_1611632 [Auriscalpium vulgare]
MSEILNRAEGAPLQISVRRPACTYREPKPILDTIDFAVANLERLRVLRIAGPHLVGHVCSLLTSPAPKIEALGLALEAEDNEPRIRADFCDASMFLGGHAPALRVLRGSANSAWLPWASPVLRGLVTLEVTSRKYPLTAEGLPSIGDVLDALEEMRALEKLVLCLFFAPRMERRTTVFIPSLTEVSLKGPMHCATLFLQGIVFSTQAKIQMHVMNEAYWFQHTSMGQDHNAGAFFAALSSSCRCVHAFHESDGHDLPWTMLQLPSWSIWSHPHTMSALGNAPEHSFAHLRELRILGDGFTEQEWRAILNVTSRVEEIHATRGTGVSLCRALRPVQSPGSDARISARKLLSLVLRNVDLASPGSSACRSVIKPPHVLRCALLANTLEARAKSGSVLARLDITKCNNVTAESVRILENALPNMTVAWQRK